jgi:hypothetical protein
MRKPEGNMQLARLRCGWERVIKMDVKQMAVLMCRGFNGLRKGVSSGIL